MLTVTGATGAFANSKLTWNGTGMMMGPSTGPTGPVATLDVAGNSFIRYAAGVGTGPLGVTGTINVSGGYYVNGVLQTGGATIAGSTTANNLLTATGTSSGIYGNSALTWSPSNTTLTVSGSSSNTTINGYGIGLGGCNANISYQLNASGQIYAGGTNGFVGTLLGGVNLNGGTLSNGTISNIGYSTTSSNFTTAVNAASNYIGGSVLCNGYLAVGTTTMPAFAGVAVTGGISLTNGYRPLYASVTSNSLTTGTTPAITASNYGTHFNITNSGFNTITLPTSSGTTDLNAYWVFRNSTSSYLNVTVTYTGTGGGGSSTLTIPPSNSTTIMFVTATSGVTAYAFF
jgi:hypothetical protein